MQLIVVKKFKNKTGKTGLNTKYGMLRERLTPICETKYNFIYNAVHVRYSK